MLYRHEVVRRRREDVSSSCQAVGDTEIQPELVEVALRNADRNHDVDERSVWTGAIHPAVAGDPRRTRRNDALGPQAWTEQLGAYDTPSAWSNAAR